jgi:hypothetical protein
MCNVDPGANEDWTFCIAYDLPRAGLLTVSASREEAMSLAKRLDSGPLDWTREALVLQLKRYETWHQDQVIDPVPGLTVARGPRRELVEALRRAVGPDVGPTGPTPDASRRDAIARVQALMAELGVTIEDLA